MHNEMHEQMNPSNGLPLWMHEWLVITRIAKKYDDERREGSVVPVLMKCTTRHHSHIDQDDTYPRSTLAPSEPPATVPSLDYVVARTISPHDRF